VVVALGAGRFREKTGLYEAERRSVIEKEAKQDNSLGGKGEQTQVHTEQGIVL
jgi:hypothetical protein